MQSYFSNEVPVLLRYNYPQFFGHDINFPKVEKAPKECEPMNPTLPVTIPPPVPQKGQKPFSCEVCGKAYAQKVSLENHISSSHTGKKKVHLVKPYPCEICGKGFTQKGNMKTHMLTHTVGKQHLCPVCGKGFTQKGNMKTHMKLHQRVPDSEKPFNCHICGHGFQLRSSLDCHLSNHEKYLGQRYPNSTGLPNMQNMAASIAASGMPNISAAPGLNVPNVSSHHNNDNKANNTHHHQSHHPQHPPQQQQPQPQSQEEQHQMLQQQLHYKNHNSLHAAVKQAYNEINNYNHNQQ